MAKILKLKIPSMVKDMEQAKRSYIVGRTVNWYNHFENDLSVAAKDGHIHTL